MPRRFVWIGAVLFGLAVWLCAQPVIGLIDKPMPLKLILVTPGQHVFLAKVEKMDAKAEPPRLVIKVQESLKKGDKVPFEQIRLLVTGGNDQAKKAKHQPELLKRLAADIPLVIFARKTDENGKAFGAFVYSNGTWFQMMCSDPSAQPWEFESCEPYLRGTFKGPTADLQKAILAFYNDKKEPPAFDKKAAEAGGFGPEVKKEEKQEDKKGGAALHTGPVFAVIPTVAIGGPLAILAMLFPSLFGNPREIMRRWLALLSVASVLSIVVTIQALFPQWFGGTSWVVLWLWMALVTLLGVLWAFRRYHSLSQRETLEELLPKRGEAIIFYLISIAGLILVPYAYGEGSLFQSPWRELLLMWIMVWAGTLGIRYVIWAAQRSPDFKPRLPLEGLMLAALAIGCLGLAWQAAPRAGAADPVVPSDTTKRDDQPPREASVAWTFKAENLGRLHSTPLIHGERVFVAVNHEAGLFDNFGRIYCLDRRTGSKIWSFDDKKKMKQVFCSPCWNDGKIYVGEGYHQHDNCRMFCLDAESGTVVWQFPTRSHTESSPCVANGRIYFGAGDDGVFCLDAKTGKEIWHYPGWHVDTNPVVVDGKLYGGTGYGTPNVMFCLDAADGKRVWQTESKLPVFGSPTVLGKQVFFGTGTGNLIESDANNKAGALACVNDTTGALIWAFKEVGDAVHTHPAVDRRHVYFGSRDGNLYCVNRADGALRWKQPVGSPIAASPTAVTCGTCGDSNSVYAIGVDGQLCCFDADDGTLFYRFDVTRQAGLPTQMVSSPRVVVTHEGKTDLRRIYFGAALDNGGIWDAVLYCLEDKYQWPVPAGQWLP